MKEIETLQRAKLYMDQLAQGIDPVSGQEMSEDSVLNQVRLARCFFYISGILEQVIANGGKVSRSVDKSVFSITPEKIASVEISAVPVRITQFIDSLYAAAGDPTQKKPGATVFTNWLLSKGFLTIVEAENGKQARVPSEAGVQIGITSELRQGLHGDYQAVLYSDRAQQFLLDNLSSILNK